MYPNANKAKPRRTTGGIGSTSALSNPAGRSGLGPTTSHNQGGRQAGGGGAREITDDQRSEILEAFKLFDSDDDGFLDYHEFKVALRALGFEKQKAECLQMIRERDRSGNDLMGEKDFEDLVAHLISLKDPLEDIHRAFKLFDEDHKGEISIKNLRRVAKELGENLADEELQAMIDEFDMSGKGTINLDDFIKIMHDGD